MANPIVNFETTAGTFQVEVFEEQMPITAGNFLKLVDDGFYNGLHFHRVIANFMIQFGCPHSADPSDPMAGRGGPPHGNIQDEFTHEMSNVRGSLSMANTGRPNSGGSQFFINLVDNTSLDWFNPRTRSQHPVFGRVHGSMDVVDAIGTTATTGHPTDRPIQPIQVVSITRAD